MVDVSNDELVRTISGQRGWLSFTGRRAGISREEVLRRAATSKEVALAIREAEGLRDDIAEQQLFKAVENGASWAITLYLRLREARRAAESAQHEGETEVGFSTEYYLNNVQSHSSETAAASDSDPGEPGAV